MHLPLHLPLFLSRRRHRKKPAYRLWIVPLGTHRLSGEAQPLPCLPQHSTGGAPPYPLQNRHRPSPSLPRDRRRSSLPGTSLLHGSLHTSAAVAGDVEASGALLQDPDAIRHQHPWRVLSSLDSASVSRLWTCRCRLKSLYQRTLIDLSGG